MVNDPIADLLTRIRNGMERTKRTVNVPSSKMLEAITSILKDEGYINDFKVEKNEAGRNEIVIELKYNRDGKPVIKKIQRVSKPGLRIYHGYRDIPRVLNGLGISIFSTPKGIMTGKSAKTQQVGGEYLCKIW